MSMQHNELLRLKSMVADSNNSDSESTSSDATIKADQETDLKYLYYRLFTNEIGITPKQPAFVANPYLGRVRRNSIAPPQTVLQLKQRLCYIERTGQSSNSILYRSASNQSPMDDGDRMHATLGSMDQPLELVVKVIMTLKPTEAYPQPQYIYYCLYTEYDIIEPKQAFKTYADGSPSIARIDINLIPPLHNLDAVIRCISYVEEWLPCVWHQLFTSIVSASPIDDLDVWGMQRGCPGSLLERPLICVKSAGMVRQLEISSKYVTLYLPHSGSVLIQHHNRPIYTDGVIRRELLSASDSEKCSVYRAWYAVEGRRGLIKTRDVRQIL
ncbi:hypothetical protein PILCRDRAFT_814001 [Piloderma croceum F 1598]|uniref:Uncharacterized protein n=1 Tax=Piloderma croceum (strain F 1598) TaxID=765440 RepID=A0A0C3CEG7_PILCF|nr:hypothetical protein PILCRDRAFT_814001 [Piloderma croceum F 1598]